MKAMRVGVPGEAEAMALVELPEPEPGRGEVLVRVEAAGVNFIDVYHRRGVYRSELPVRMGREGAGVVLRAGPDAGVAEGTRVAWADVPGSYATHVLAPVERLVPVPTGVAPQAAAAVMLQGMTAHYLATATYTLGPEDACLVHAAAGGVGLLLCQFAARAGARVFGTVSTEAKAELAREHGAREVIVYSREDFVAPVRSGTGGEGVAVVYDAVGRDTWERSLACVRVRGMLVLYGQSSGVVPPIDPLELMARGSLFLTRPSLAHYVASREALQARAGAVLSAVASGSLRLRIGECFPLADAAEAHRRLEGRATTGKVLLVP